MGNKSAIAIVILICGDLLAMVFTVADKGFYYFFNPVANQINKMGQGKETIEAPFSSILSIDKYIEQSAEDNAHRNRVFSAASKGQSILFKGGFYKVKHINIKEDYIVIYRKNTPEITADLLSVDTINKKENQKDGR